MLKRLAILAIWLILTGMVSGQPDKNARPNQQPAKQEQPALHPANGEQSQAKADHDQGKPTGVSQGRYASLKWPEWMHDSNWWLVIIAGLTGGMIGWQSWATSEAAKGAKSAADAALLNARAVINAERALLLFTVEKERLQSPEGPAIFHINVVNYGRVPARRLEISCPNQVVMTPDDLWPVSPPKYGTDLPEIKEWLAPKESCRVATFYPYKKRTERVEVAQKSGIGLDRIEVMIYGQVTYGDGISSDKRHSRYCFMHDREPFSNIGGSLIPWGGDEYLECT